jgi:tRNA (guanine37-N1)-methyltransferase
MRSFSVITIFPEVIETYKNLGLFKRAEKNKLFKITTVNPRAFAKDKRKTIDGRPYSGGPGMVLQVEPILKAVAKLGIKNKKFFILSPRGKTLDATRARTLAKSKNDLVFISGRYEGIDARVKKILKAEEISIGSYVLSGGELPALVVIESVARFIPGFLGKEESLEESRLAPPEQYSRPEVFIHKGKKYSVPKVLLSGNHKKIKEFWEKELKKRENK